MKLGSLFDGSGGFPLSGSLCGITPAWAAEVEPYPIAVTTSRFPNMKHLGSVTDINGAEIEPVDIITFGSPCQDLSVAGKRAGLKHEANGDEETTRSGLFMEAVRIIKEMRRATNGVYPTFAIWENVPGAFSSNSGDDFRVVLEEFIKIVEPDATVPAPDKGKWPYADAYVGDGWSLAYRTLDAQYWGVPQRRRRIYLVVDFRGECAHKILFEREGLRGHFETCRTPWQGTAGNAENCPGADDREGERNCLTPWDVQSRRIFTVDGPWPALYGGEGGGHGYACIPYTLKIRSGCEGGGKGALIQNDKSATLLDDQGGSQIGVRNDGKAPTLRAEMHGNVPCVLAKEQHLFENHSQDTRYKGPLDVCPIVSATFGMGGNNQPFVVEGTPVYCLQGSMIGRADKNGPQGDGVNENVAFTCNTIDRHAVAYCTDVGWLNSVENQSPTLLARQYKDPHLVCCPVCVAEAEAPVAIDRAAFNQGQNAQYTPQYYTDGTCPTLVARGPGAVAHKQEVRYIVRRLTPTECARLQGFPDKWGHITPKEDFTDEEYHFWLEVRNTHAAINGKTTKEYTKQQMLTWYNKLHTDSAEYKMWGNGIALPTALYVMQGIADELERGRCD